MPSVMRSFRLPEDLNERVNAAAGEDFSAWARAAFEAKLVGEAFSPSRLRSSVGQTQDRADLFRAREALLRERKRT